RGLALLRCPQRPLQRGDRWLRPGVEDRHGPGEGVARQGSERQAPSQGPYPSFGSRLSVLLPRIPEAGRAVQHEGIDEQKRQLLRQRPYGELLGYAQERGCPSPALQNERGGTQRHYRIHRGLLQPAAASEAAWLSIPRGIWEAILRQAGSGMKDISCPLLTSGVIPPLKVSTFVNFCKPPFLKGSQDKGIRKGC